MIIYDLCDQIREGVQQKIDGKYYDISLECWSPLEAKLKGKGRTKRKKLRFTCHQPKLTRAMTKKSRFQVHHQKTWLSDAVN